MAFYVSKLKKGLSYLLIYKCMCISVYMCMGALKNNLEIDVGIEIS